MPDFRLVFFFCRQPGDRGEGLAEFEVIHFDAVVEVQFDAGLGEGQQRLAFPLFALMQGLGELVGLLAGFGLVAGAGGADLRLGEVGEAVAQHHLVVAEVAVEHQIERVPGVAVQVNQNAETFLGTLYQPVDGPLLVGLEVVLVEIGEEIFPQILAQGVLDEAEVLLERGFAKSGAQELAGAGHNVVLSVLTLHMNTGVPRAAIYGTFRKSPV